MNELIINALQEIKSWPFNDKESGRQFENRVIDCLALHTGLQIRKIPQKKNINPEKRLFQLLKTLGPGYYWIPEPNGSQNPPDVRLIKYENQDFSSLLDIDMKRTGQNLPMWNSGIPELNTIYIGNFNLPKPGGTTILLGNHLITQEEIEKDKQFKDALCKRKTELPKMLGVNNFPIEALSHIRPMYSWERELTTVITKTGDRKIKAGWLDSQFRSKREADVLSYIKMLDLK